MFAGKDIYTQLYKDGYHYYYSTLFAILIYPLSFLPYYAAALLWLLLNLFFFFRTIQVIGKYFSLNTLSPRIQWVFLVLCFIASIKFVIQNIDCQQITMCILYLTVEGLDQVFSGKKTLGALLIALAINIKIFPVLFIPYLLYRKELRASIFTILFYVLLLELPALVIGVAQNNFYLISWWHLINPNDPLQITDSDEGGNFYSLITLLSTLFIKQPHLPDAPACIKNPIINLTINQFQYLILIVRLFFAFLTLYFLRTMPFKSSTGKAHRFWEISYLLLIVPLIFPHQPFYAYLFSLPAFCHVCYYIVKGPTTFSKAKYYTLTAIFAASVLLFNIRFIIGPIGTFYSYLKFPVWAALLLLIALAMCKASEEKLELS